MIYEMITKKRDAWYRSADCPIGAVTDYIMAAGSMRDAQVEAIKTYLYLKVACGNRPLWELFYTGTFNSLDVDEMPVRARVRQYLSAHPEAMALYEYASQAGESGSPLSEALCRQIEQAPSKIDYEGVFRQLFYQISYTDYLFSLPMGAGKTYLMAAFIYLDLYFGLQEPENPAFARNFIIFAPSGLKSSVVPSLKTIQNFDVEWILPKEAALQVRKLAKFEVLDKSRTAKKGNRTKNPNAGKLQRHQPFADLVGLVAVTNAEKVILDHVELRNGQVQLTGSDSQSNELREVIGQIPGLSIFIDEVHHASTEEIKLRAVVSAWMQENQSVNSVIGFSGTPYLAKASPVAVAEGLVLRSIYISNTVYYYPLVDAVDNFLKCPEVKVSTADDGLRIIEAGVRDFLGRYGERVYEGGLTAKLAIYCGKGNMASPIDYLEEIVYPHVAAIVEEYGLNPREAVLKYHQGKKNHPVTAENHLRFQSLDKPFSNVRIVLLVQIGKEGWDCRSLTGVILSQKGDCPTNMVLQTACRCLRQVTRGEKETALIWLNEHNARTLKLQLEQQHHINVEEFQKGGKGKPHQIKRYSRAGQIPLLPLDFYQMRVEYRDEVQSSSSIGERLAAIRPMELLDVDMVRTQSLEGVVYYTKEQWEEASRRASYSQWLYSITKQRFGALSMEQLRPYDTLLQGIFREITVQEDGGLLYNPHIPLWKINGLVRAAFTQKRELCAVVRQEKTAARLLREENLDSVITTDTPEKYFPSSEAVERILQEDAGEGLTPEEQALLQAAEKMGAEMLAVVRDKLRQTPGRNRAFHYLPYHLDSGLENKLLEALLPHALLEEHDLYLFYNGERAMTEFRIRAYQKGKAGQWKNLGFYTPDFLLARIKGNKIYKVLMMETKGEGYESDFAAKKEYMEELFVPENNRQFGYRRFHFLYLREGDNHLSEIARTANEFFREDR